MRQVWLLLLLILPFEAFSADVFHKFPNIESYSTSEKFLYWSESFIALPYAKGGPLGEGKSGKYDQDPLYRFDRFDCTTFVETVTALSLSTNKSEFKEHLNKLRYKHAEVSYLTRNHIISQSWIPENTNNAYYSDVTRSFPVKFQKSASALIDLPGWYKKHSLNRLRVQGLSTRKKKKRLKSLQALGRLTVAQEVKLPYLAIKSLLESWDEFKVNVEGIYIVNIVRPNWNIKKKIGTNLNISHQGILLIKNGEIIMIHASTSGSVREVKLKDYLAQFKYSRSIKGINLLQINL